MRHLKHQYHVETFMAVEDVSFELKKGDMLGIIGTNGAGKSTLLKAVIGVMEPRSGVVVLFVHISSHCKGPQRVRRRQQMKPGGWDRPINHDLSEIADIQDSVHLEVFFAGLSGGVHDRV